MSDTSKKRILGIDPGETTGVAYWDGQLWICEETPNWQDLEPWIEFTDVAVIERYSLYAGKANAKTHSTFPEVEVIGVIKYLCQRYGVNMVVQGADHKAFYSDTKLTNLGLYHPSKHVRDALRHALWYKQFKLEAA